MPVGQRPPGGLDHLERARYACTIARLEPLGGNRIAPRKLRMQRLDAVAFKPSAHRFAHVRRNRRHGREPARQRLEVKAGAAFISRRLTDDGWIEDGFELQGVAGDPGKGEPAKMEETAAPTGDSAPAGRSGLTQLVRAGR